MFLLESLVFFDILLIYLIILLYPVETKFLEVIYIKIHKNGKIRIILEI